MPDGGRAHEGQGKEAVQPDFARADGPTAGFVAVNAVLRTEGLERAVLSHEAELAVAMGATIVHDALLTHGRGPLLTRCGYIAAQYYLLQCTKSLRRAKRDGEVQSWAGFK